MRQLVLTASLWNTEHLRKLWDLSRPDPGKPLSGELHKAAVKVSKRMEELQGQLSAVRTALHSATSGSAAAQASNALSKDELKAFSVGLLRPLIAGLVRYAAVCKAAGLAPLVSPDPALKLAARLDVQCPGVKQALSALEPEDADAAVPPSAKRARVE